MQKELTLTVGAFVTALGRVGSACSSRYNSPFQVGSFDPRSCSSLRKKSSTRPGLMRGVAGNRFMILWFSSISLVGPHPHRHNLMPLKEASSSRHLPGLSAGNWSGSRDGLFRCNCGIRRYNKVACISGCSARWRCPLSRSNRSGPVSELFHPGKTGARLPPGGSGHKRYMVRHR